MYPISLIEPEIDFLSIILLLGLVQGFFLIYFLLFNQKKDPANKYLGGIVLTFCFSLTEIFLNYSGYIVDCLHLLNFSQPYTFLLGPLLYFHLHHRLGLKKGVRYRWHYLPFFFYLLYWGFFLIQPWEYKYNAYISSFRPEMELIPNVVKQFPHDPLNIRKLVVIEGMVTHLLSYLILSFFLLRKILKKTNSIIHQNKKSLHFWIKYITLTMLLGTLIFVSSRGMFDTKMSDFYIGSFLVLNIYFISFKVLGKSSFFEEMNLNRKVKYQKSTLSLSYKKALLQKVLHLMEEDKPFLETSFSLSNLAQLTKIAPHHLSQILNEELEQNFFEFVADHRIKEAEKLLIHPEYQVYTIEAIAKTIGYNSKSTFFKAFKKKHKLTPTQYKQIYLQNSISR